MMKKSLTAISSLIILTLIFAAGCTGSKEIAPPIAQKIPKKLVIHDDERIDNYYWLNERDNPAVMQYLLAENAYLDAVMAPTTELQNTLYREITGRIKQVDESVPYLDNGYYYYHRYSEGQEYPVYCRKKDAPDAVEEILIDGPAMARGHDFFHVTGLAVSENNRYLVFGVDTVSRRKYTLYIKDLITGDRLPDEIPNTNGRAVWANDNRTIFYVTKDSTLRPDRVWHHHIGTAPDEDREFYYEPDNTFNLDIYKTTTRKYIVLASTQTLSTEFRLLDADDVEAEPVIFSPREADHEYYIYDQGDRFLVLTNWQAKNFRLMETGTGATGKDHWRELVPHNKDILLEGVTPFKDYIVIRERTAGKNQIRVISLKDRSEYYIDFEEPNFIAYPEDNRRFDTDTLRFYYESLTTPESVFDYNMTSRERKLLKEQEVGGGFDHNNYTSERVWAVARDSVLVPVTMVYRKGMVRDGNNPLLLYGYGSYGASMDPYFQSPELSLIDRGFIYAIAHIRGGAEMGRQWYEDGKLLKKKNTFNDFIDCAEYLVAQKYTSPEFLFAQGGSAGGLLIGAVVNARPDLFKGVIASVPWVDVVTTMLDESIPLTTAEFDEWGNPKDPVYYKYMLSYSPYDNVKAQNYPAMFVTTGLHDSQVQYFEPAKWVAKLRTMKTDHNLLVLDVDLSSGHGGASGRFARYKRTALEYAFILSQLGMNE
jgi:oligopeptidase B